MKYALIGCGRIATNHIKAALSNNLEITAVCDINMEHVKLLLGRNGLLDDQSIKIYTDYRLMLSEVKPQLVAIATDSDKHAKIALDCISSGAHVIIEKPIAMNIHDAESIILASREKGVKVSVCFQNRFNTPVQETRTALEMGCFGKLSHGSIQVRWNRDENYYKMAAWRGTWACDGGALMNQCIHGIDLLRWMMGDEVESVYGVTRRRFHPYIEAEDVGLAVVTFRNGTIATIEGTTNVYPQNLEETLCLFGEKGTVKIGGKSTNNIETWNFSTQEAQDIHKIKQDETTTNVYGNGHNKLYEDVISAIENNREPYVNAEAGKNALEIVLAIYKSQADGLPVTLPLADFSTTDMKGIW